MTRASLFWDVTPHKLVVSYRRFGTSCLKMRSIFCSETWVTYYQYALRDIPEERKSYLHRDGSLKSRIDIASFARKCLLLLCLVYTGLPRHNVVA
jgi:hypothetical protein